MYSKLGSGRHGIGIVYARNAEVSLLLTFSCAGGN